MTRLLAVLPVLSVLALAACAPPVPDSGAGGGVGFDNYVEYQQRRAAAPSTGRIVANPQIVTPPVAAPQSESQVIAGEALAAIGARPAGIPPVAAAPAPVAAAATASVAPRPLPAAGSSGPNIVAFALATSHPVGQQMYRRSALGSGRSERSCARFTSDGIAQEEFLRRGGPERDPMGVDPDGDGYACRWDPAPFRIRGG